jgi:hypothetical protein
MIEQSIQSKTIADLAAKAIVECEELAKRWRKNVGKPNPAKMHPFGDVIRGMNSQLKIAHRLARRAQRMLQPKDELAVRGILTTCLAACQIAYSFHDEQISSYIQVFGAPANEEDLYHFAYSTKSVLDRAQYRLKNFVVNPASDRALAAFGETVKERAKHVESVDRHTKFQKCAPEKTPSSPTKRYT